MAHASSNANGSGGSVEEKRGEIARKHQQGEGKMVIPFIPLKMTEMPFATRIQSRFLKKN